MNKADLEKFEKKLAKVIARRRKELGLSHEKLAGLAGVNRSTISLIKNQKIRPTASVCYKLAVAMGTRLSVLIADTEN